MSVSICGLDQVLYQNRLLWKGLHMFVYDVEFQGIAKTIGDVALVAVTMGEKVGGPSVTLSLLDADKF